MTMTETVGKEVTAIAIKIFGLIHL